MAIPKQEIGFACFGRGLAGESAGVQTHNSTGAVSKFQGLKAPAHVAQGIHLKFWDTLSRFQSAILTFESSQFGAGTTSMIRHVSGERFKSSVKVGAKGSCSPSLKPLNVDGLYGP